MQDISFKVVSDKEYTAWLQDAKKKYASNETGTTFAANDKPAGDKPANDNKPNASVPLRIAGAQ